MAWQSTSAGTGTYPTAVQFAPPKVYCLAERAVGEDAVPHQSVTVEGVSWDPLLAQYVLIGEFLRSGI
jgi:hypothetical protein